MKFLVGKIALGTVVLLALTAFLVSVIGWQLQEEDVEPQYTVLSEPPAVPVSAWVVFDVETSEQLAALKPDQQLPIASITKLATAALVRERADLSATATIAYADTLAEGRAGKLQAGEVYTVRDLLFPLLLESSNDAAAVLARIDEGLLGAMNQTVADNDLASTTFADTSGLSAQNVATAAELALLAAHIYHTQPYIFDITRLPEYYAQNNGWFNNSPFIADPDYRGGKHGFTYEANRTAVAFFAEQFAGGERMVGYVLLGSDDLTKDMATLRRYVADHVQFE